MSVTVYSETSRKRGKREGLNIHLAPEDRRLFVTMCDEECRTYGEMLGLLVREKAFRSQARDERTA